MHGHNAEPKMHVIIKVSSSNTLALTSQNQTSVHYTFIGLFYLSMQNPEMACAVGSSLNYNSGASEAKRKWYGLERRACEIADTVPFDPARKSGKRAGFETRSLSTRYASKRHCWNGRTSTQLHFSEY